MSMSVPATMAGAGSGAATINVTEPLQNAMVSVRSTNSGFNAGCEQLHDLTSFDINQALGLASPSAQDFSTALEAAAHTLPTPTLADLPSIPAPTDPLTCSFDNTTATATTAFSSFDLDQSDVDQLLASLDVDLAPLKTGEERHLAKTPDHTQHSSAFDLDLTSELDHLLAPVTAPSSGLCAPTQDNLTCHEAFRPIKSKSKSGNKSKSKSKRTAQARRAIATSPSSSTSEQLTAAGKPRKRAKKVAVADHLKDEAYLEYRRLNNERARRCREARKKREMEEKGKLDELNHEHEQLQDEAAALRNALKELTHELELRVQAKYGAAVPVHVQSLLASMTQSTANLTAAQ